MRPLVAALFAALLTLPACQSTKIALKESVFGIPKRDQLVARVEDARDSQEAAKKQFAGALDEFLALTGAKGSELETKYRTLGAKYQSSADAAAKVTANINAVETVADKLFAEWKSELSQYDDSAMRSSSEQLLRTTRGQYGQLLEAMKSAESKMDPVLRAFKDRVLFLKHNLNAQAIASLKSNVGQVQNDVTRLITEMEASINEANKFIQQMQTGSDG